MRKQKNTGKFLSILLCLVMVLGTLSTAALADEPKPEAPITCRLLERSADQSYIRSHLNELRTFADMTESHWAYWYAMEAANGHDYTKSGGSENWSRTYR